MRTVVEALQAARELLSDPERWTHDGRYAEDDLGLEVPARSPRAVCWCAIGALSRVTRGARRRLTSPAYCRLRQAARTMGYLSVAALNDEGELATVHRMYDLAIDEAS